MKRIYIFTIFLFLLFYNCKKDAETPSSGNFIEINGDRRIIDATNENVIFEYGTWGDPGYQFTIKDNQFSEGIAGLPNSNLLIVITIWDNNLSKSNYTIVDSSDNTPTGYSQAYMELSKKNRAIINRFGSKANSGTIKYSLVNSKKIIEFSKIKLVDSGGTFYTVSGRMEFYGYPHNEHW